LDQKLSALEQWYMKPEGVLDETMGRLLVPFAVIMLGAFLILYMIRPSAILQNDADGKMINSLCMWKTVIATLALGAALYIGAYYGFLSRTAPMKIM